MNIIRTWKRWLLAGFVILPLGAMALGYWHGRIYSEGFTDGFNKGRQLERQWQAERTR